MGRGLAILIAKPFGAAGGKDPGMADNVPVGREDGGTADGSLLTVAAYEAGLTRAKRDVSFCSH
jgi:hypothetical protein